MRPEIEKYLSDTPALLPEMESRRLNAALVAAASWPLDELRAANAALSPMPFSPGLERPGLLDLLRKRLWRRRLERLALTIKAEAA